MIGGHHPTVSRLWLEGCEADYLVVGEGGIALRHLADSLERGGRFDMVQGLAPLGGPLENLHAPQIHSLDELPPPDRSVTRAHRHDYFHSVYRPVALVRFSAGCPYRCTFCILWRMTGQRYLTKHADRIVTELSAIDVENVYVVDDEAFIQPARMMALAAAIGEAGIRKRYHMYVRADTAIRNPAVIERWAETGLDSVLMGAESMDEQDLLDYEKAAHVTDTREAMRLFHRVGVRVRANFIVRPEYGEEDFDRLSETVQSLGVDLPSFAVLTPLPGTVLFDERKHELISDNPDLFDCYHTLFRPRLPLPRFYDRVASLLEAAAARNPSPDAPSPGVFYYSNGAAFQRMIETIRGAHHLHVDRFREESQASTASQERTAPCTLQQPLLQSR